LADTDLSGINVLIVEDDSFSQTLMRALLGKLGIGAIHAADNGIAALARLEDSAADFDLIISDIEMPEMDGHALISKIRSGAVPKYKNVPILVISGKEAEDSIASRGYELSGFIAKPPTAENLSTALNAALGN
jgi:CheY-like chemotaxis protein